MSTDAEKIALLKDAGFRYDFDREVYFNRRIHKVFSLEAIEDHDETWLKTRLEEEGSPEEWHFYFNTNPSQAVRSELVAELEQ